MSLPAELVELMNDEIVLAPYSGKDKYNNFTWGTPVTVKCYLQRRNVRALDRAGREVTSTMQAILATPELSVTPNDLLTLPDGTTPAIIEVLSSPDENGDPYYLEVRA